MIDNFAIPAATIRGLFDYEYRSDRLILRPRVPGSITEYVQKEPVRFGEKSLYLLLPQRRHEGQVGHGQRQAAEGRIAGRGGVLPYDDLPTKAKVEIVTEGGWAAEPSPATAPADCRPRRRSPPRRKPNSPNR